MEKNILVVGDVMLDLYWHGSVKRISPEAPVPVLLHGEEHARLGGAANVAANLHSLGQSCQLMGLCGDDDWGELLKEKLRLEGIPHHLTMDPSACTITKLRILQQIQQLIRIDWEKKFSSQIAEQLLPMIEHELDNQTIKAIILSDYSKGTLCCPQSIIQLTRSKNLPIIVDPKGDDFLKYKQSFCLTPNDHEFKLVMGEAEDYSTI